jgi:hypothetical protein
MYSYMMDARRAAIMQNRGHDPHGPIQNSMEGVCIAMDFAGTSKEPLPAHGLNDGSDKQKEPV